MSLFDGAPHDAATERLYHHLTPVHSLASDTARDVLNAALAALPREELVEKAATEDVWMYRAANGMRLERSRQEVIERIAEAWGLIPVWLEYELNEGRGIGATVDDLGTGDGTP